MASINTRGLLMQTKYSDYSNHVGLRIRYELRRISLLPIRGVGKITYFLNKIVPKPRPKGLCIIKTIHGFKILVDPIIDKGLERVLFIYGTYEEGTLRIINHILKDNGFLNLPSKRVISIFYN